MQITVATQIAIAIQNAIAMQIPIVTRSAITPRIAIANAHYNCNANWNCNTNCNSFKSWNRRFISFSSREISFHLARSTPSRHLARSSRIISSIIFGNPYIIAKGQFSGRCPQLPGTQTVHVIIRIRPTSFCQKGGRSKKNICSQKRWTLTIDGYNSLGDHFRLILTKY